LAVTFHIFVLISVHIMSWKMIHQFKGFPSKNVAKVSCKKH
jgi:hypothetical protein